MSLARQKFSLVNIWAATAAYLRSKGYMRSKFQNGKFPNLIADSESLQKIIKRNCLSFFDIPSGTWFNWTLKVIIRSNLLFCLKFGLFQCLMIILTLCSRWKDCTVFAFLNRMTSQYHPCLYA